MWLREEDPQGCLLKRVTKKHSSGWEANPQQLYSSSVPQCGEGGHGANGESTRGGSPSQVGRREGLDRTGVPGRTSQGWGRVCPCP